MFRVIRYCFELRAKVFFSLFFIALLSNEKLSPFALISSTKKSIVVFIQLRQSSTWQYHVYQLSTNEFICLAATKRHIICYQLSSQIHKLYAYRNVTITRLHIIQCSETTIHLKLTTQLSDYKLQFLAPFNLCV